MKILRPKTFFLFSHLCPISFPCDHSNNIWQPVSFALFWKLYHKLSVKQIIWLVLSYFCPFAFILYFTQLFYYFVRYDYTLITNLMHWLLFIHKILFSCICLEPQVLFFRRIQLYTCSICYCQCLWEFLMACRYTAWVLTHAVYRQVM